jgi:hypothetical protein
MQLSRTDFKDKWQKQFEDNDEFLISAADLREFSDDIQDSFFSSAASNVPEYAPRTFYAKDYLVTFNGPFFRAKVAGYLPPPMPGEETDAWKPSEKPLSAVLAYQELPVIQAQDYSSDGRLDPTTLYRLRGRTSADGLALDDVLVVAMSRRSVAGADAYLIGLDAQTREEYLLPVSYELATDTTAPRAAGVGGAVDAYTKAEVDGLLADKGSAQVQEQQGLQLKTLGVQASPVYSYPEAGGVEGFTSADEALADTGAKTFARFNLPKLQITKSNSPTGEGWPYYVYASGATLEIGENVTLTLAGEDYETLYFYDFFIYAIPGKRGGRVSVLSTATAGTPVAQLPRLNGRSALPFMVSGAVAMSGHYTSLGGTGTVYVLEPFQCDFVAGGITLVRSGQLPPATESALGGLIVGAGLQVDEIGTVSLKIDSSTLGQRADGTLYVPTTSGTINAAATPTNVTAVRDHPRTGTLVSWDAMPGATFYQVYRQVNGSPWSLIAGVPYNFHFDNSGDGQGDLYVLYRVHAANSVGQSPASVLAQAQ